MEGSHPTSDDIPAAPRYPSRGDALSRAGAAEIAGPGGQGVISLGPRDVLVGRLVFDGDLRVQGSLEGEVTLSGDLHVDGQGTVKAKVQARSLSVRGAVEGEVTVKDRLVVAGSGTVSGTVRVARLVVEDGALLNGSITMERTGPSTNGRPAGG